MSKAQQNQRKRQQKALKKRTERKRKLSSQKMQSKSSPDHVRQARSYPIEGCWAQRNWKDDGLAVIAVARRQPDGALVYGTYLVDYLCTGLKNTRVSTDVPSGAFHGDLLPSIFQKAQVEITTEIAHEIVHGGIEYAAQWGLRPHRDFRLSLYILDPPEAHERTGQVEFGKDGKPYYVAGPRDNTRRILEQLRRTAGEGNFMVMMPSADSPDVEEEHDEEEEDGLWVPPAGIMTPDEFAESRKQPVRKEDEGKSEDSSALWVPGSAR